MTLNFAFYLSLILATMGCAGLVLAGRGRWYGWGIGLAVQPVWAVYAIVTHGYGLLITCAMYGTVNARNLWKWRQRMRNERFLNEMRKRDGVNPLGVYIDETWSYLYDSTSEAIRAYKEESNDARPSSSPAEGDTGAG